MIVRAAGLVAGRAISFAFLHTLRRQSRLGRKGSRGSTFVNARMRSSRLRQDQRMSWPGDGTVNVARIESGGKVG